MTKKELQQVKRDLKKLGTIWFVTGMGFLIAGTGFWLYLLK